MAIARVTAQDAVNALNAASISATYPSTPTQYRLLRAAVYANVGTGVVDVSGWTKAKEALTSSAGGASVSLWWKIAGASESTTVTATAAGATIMRIQISEYTGVDSLNPVDVASDAAPATTNVNSQVAAAAGQLATSNADDLLVAVWGMNTTTTAQSVDVPSAFTLVTPATTRLTTAERVVSATGTYNPTLSWTTATRAGGVLVAFKAGIAGSAAAPAATGSGAGVAPTVTVTASVAAPASVGSGAGVAPTVGVVLTVAAPAATGSAAGVAPTATGAASVAAAVAAGTGAAPAPTAGGAAGVSAPAPTGSGAGRVPTVAVGIVVVATLATGSAAALAPTVTVGVAAPVWPPESVVEVLPAVYAAFPGAQWPPAGRHTPVSVAAVASWHVERELVGSVLPGNVRARSGLSIGSAGVSLAQPGSDRGLLTPWSRDPARRVTVGETAELYAAHGGYDSDVRIDLGDWVVAPAQGSLVGAEVTVDLLERPVRARALNQGLPVIRDTVDPAWMVDALARQVGYHSTPDAVPSAIIAATLAGGGTPSVGLFGGADVDSWDRRTGTLGTAGAAIAIYVWLDSTAVLGADNVPAYLTLNTVGTVLISFGVYGHVGGPQIELRPGGVVAARTSPAAAWSTTTYQTALDPNHPHRVQLEMKPGDKDHPGMYVRARSAHDAPWSSVAGAAGGTWQSAFPHMWFTTEDDGVSSAAALQLTREADPALWTPNNAELHPLGSRLPAAWLGGDLDPWAGIQAICAAHLGACWVRADKTLVLQDEQYLAGIGIAGETLDVGKRVEDLGWTVDPADTADRLVVTYSPVDLITVDENGQWPVVWAAQDAIELKPFASVEIDVELDFYAQVPPVPRWIGAWDTAHLSTNSTFSTFDSRDGATSGTLAAYGGVNIAVRHISGTKFVIRLTNNLNTTLWTVDATGAPCLFLRAPKIAPQATTATVVRGAAEVDAVNALTVDLGKLVQRAEDAERIADYIWARVSTQMWKASSVRTRLDWRTDIGDIIRLVHDRTGLSVKALVTKVARDGRPGEIVQNLDVVLLPVTWSDFDEAWAGATWDDFDAVWSGDTWPDFDADPLRR